MSPSLGSIDLLEQLPELRKTDYLLDYQFIIQGYNSEQPDGRDVWGKVWGKGTELPCPLQVHHLPVTPHVHQPRSSLNPILQGFFYGDLIT